MIELTDQERARRYRLVEDPEGEPFGLESITQASESGFLRVDLEPVLKLQVGDKLVIQKDPTLSMTLHRVE